MKEIINYLESLTGVIKVCPLKRENILRIIDFESERGTELIPAFNRGVQECFKRDVTFVIFKKGFFRPPPSPTMMLIFDGEVLGHDIFSSEDREKFKDDGDVQFLSDDCIYGCLK